MPAAEIAARLQTAWEQRTPVAPFSEDGTIVTPEEAYAAQRAWAALRAQSGETTVGRKIGLTSPTMRAQMGVDEPDYGDLWGSRYFPTTDGMATIPTAPFIQARVEGELAFLLDADLDGEAVTEDDVRAATAGIAPAIEVVDSRIEDWRITLVDTIADNASFGGFAHGPWSRRLLEVDLVALPLTVSRNGTVVVQETGAAVMGSPVAAVAWLARKLAGFGVPLRAGDIVLSGSFGGALELAAGDVFTITVPGEPDLGVAFA